MVPLVTIEMFNCVSTRRYGLGVSLKQVYEAVPVGSAHVEPHRSASVCHGRHDFDAIIRRGILSNLH